VSCSSASTGSSSSECGRMDYRPDFVSRGFWLILKPSFPASAKARQVAAWMARRFVKVQYLPKPGDGPSRNYRRFVVASQTRSGSTMMLDALRAHSQVVALGEVFYPPRCDIHLDGLPNDNRAVKLYRDEYPVQFLEEVVFQPYRQRILAVGFKIFPGHLSEALKAISRDNQVRVIHLKRWNHFAAHLSGERALKTGVWARTNESESESLIDIELDPLECERAFERRVRAEEWWRRIFNRHEVMEVWYEHLSSQPDRELARVQRHIGVDLEAIASRTLKQRREPLSRAVSNFDELASYFNGTRWEAYFRDEWG